MKNLKSFKILLVIACFCLVFGLEGKAQCVESYIAANLPNYEVRFDARSSVVVPPNQINQYIWTIFDFNNNFLEQVNKTTPGLNYQFPTNETQPFYTVCLDVEATGDLACLEQLYEQRFCALIKPTP